MERTSHYFHVPSGMSTWTRPRYPTPEELEEIQRKVRTADPATGLGVLQGGRTLFYYNPFTGMSQWTHAGDDAVITFVDAHSDDEADDEEPGPPPEYDGPSWASSSRRTAPLCVLRPPKRVVNSGRLRTRHGAGGEKERHAGRHSTARRRGALASSSFKNPSSVTRGYIARRSRTHRGQLL